ncbi:MAG: hypothetical protein AB7S26_28150 [Sandaracinaceae bacterium]
MSARVPRNRGARVDAGPEHGQTAAVRQLSDEAKATLIERLRTHLDRWSPTAFMTGPIVTPDPASFPDAYTHDLIGLRTVARRMLVYAGLSGLEVDVVGYADPDPDPLAPTVVQASEISDHAVRFDVFSQGPAEDLPLVLAHEVARVYYRLFGGRDRGDHPYRLKPPKPTQALSPDDEASVAAVEEEVSLTAVYLGFGLLAAIGSHQHKAQSRIEGRTVSSRWVHRSVGALAPDEACFLLALQAVVRDLDDSVIAGWRKALTADPATMLARFVKELRPRADEIRKQLGVPAADDASRITHVELTALDDDGWTPAELARDEEEAPLEFAVFRRRTHGAWKGLLVTGGLGVAGFLGAAIGADDLLEPVLIAGGALTGAGFLVGRFVRGPDLCSRCEATIPADASRCPGCGGVVKGELRGSQNHLDALEELTDASSLTGVLAGDQPDAAPRYRELGVKCPKCAWIPDGEGHWDCTECEARRFNTFAHGGQCPECETILDETPCPECGLVSDYDWWWPRQADGSES